MLGFSHSLQRSLTLTSRKDICSKYYVRLYTQDKPEVLGQIAQILGDNDISIKAFLQKEHEDKGVAKLLFSTHTSIESNITNALRAFESLPSVLTQPYTIRIED